MSAFSETLNNSFNENDLAFGERLGEGGGGAHAHQRLIPLSPFSPLFSLLSL